MNAQAEIQKMIERANTETDISMLRLLSELTISNQLPDYQELTGALKSHILAESEKYLFDYPGEAKLVFDKTIDNLRPIIGFEVEHLILALQQRKKQWKKLNLFIPTMDYQVICNTQSAQWKLLSEPEKRKLSILVNSGETLEKIRYNLGEDSIKIARTFSKLIKQELVVIKAKSNDLPSRDNPPFIEETPKSLAPEIVIVDDSPVLLKQFSSVATGLGYRVRGCDDAVKAIDILLESEPVVIFLDVNMPNLSGFQLMKQIRLQPKLSSIPLVILTAEKRMMNQQRAKWSKSEFLSKPLNSEDRLRFVSELKTLLQSLAPITQ
ncbi:MAG: response regulator [Xenococcaceae cyanobacterium MO_167.B27]|nr:response regulator [Xenococcaceae cyanobacterium MO_167.B27]